MYRLRRPFHELKQILDREISASPEENVPCLAWTMLCRELAVSHPLTHPLSDGRKTYKSYRTNHFDEKSWVQIVHRCVQIVYRFCVYRLCTACDDLSRGETNSFDFDSVVCCGRKEQNAYCQKKMFRASHGQCSVDDCECLHVRPLTHPLGDGVSIKAFIASFMSYRICQNWEVRCTTSRMNLQGRL